ncbi:MAG: hypothetical protein JW832_13465, partial [Deltaproteobacteria bacterium]|nr:hypothetical protein [Deltaproteobacteria bacterium]
MEKIIKLLTSQNIPDYLVRKGIIQKTNDVIELKELTNGNSMFVTLAEIHNFKIKKIIIRQALNYARVKTQYKITSKRLNWEAIALEKYRKFVSNDILPEVILHDDFNRVLIMKDSLGPGKYLYNEYFSGHYYLKLLRKFAVFFANLHGNSYGASKTIWMSHRMHK